MFPPGDPAIGLWCKQRGSGAISNPALSFWAAITLHGNGARLGSRGWLNGSGLAWERGALGMLKPVLDLCWDDLECGTSCPAH